MAAPGRECPGCGKTLTDRQKGACSGKCRAKLSRQRHAAALQAEVASLGQGIQVLRARLDTLAARPFTLVEGYTRCCRALRDWSSGRFDGLPIPMLLGVTERIGEWRWM